MCMHACVWFFKHYPGSCLENYFFLYKKWKELECYCINLVERSTAWKGFLCGPCFQVERVVKARR